MKAVYYAEIGQVEVREVADPIIQEPTDIIVRVEAASICGSDLHIIGGFMFDDRGFTIGHEYIGEVVEVGGAIRQFQIGDRVVGPPAPWCGECPTCRRRMIGRCERGGVLGSGPAVGDLGGAQAEYIRVPWADQDLVRIPAGVTDRQALSVADCLTTGYTGVVNAKVEMGDTVVVLGAGPVGLGAVHTAKLLTGAAQVISVDRVPSRLGLAKQLGADHTLLSGPDTAQQILDLTDGRGAEVFVDAAGVQATLDLASTATILGGTVAIMALPHEPLSVDIHALVEKCVTVVMGLGDLSLMDGLMRRIADGTLDPTPMFTHEIPIDEAPAMYARLAAGDLDAVKVMIRP